MRAERIILVLTAWLAGTFVIAARPGGIAAAVPGLWEVSRSATGAGPERRCIPDPAFLAQWEGRNSTCTRTLISEEANAVTFDFKCANGTYGHSELTLLTPRSLRVDTQGISGGLPYEYQLFARRTAACPAR